MPLPQRDQFPELTRDALAHLYDFAYLRTHPLLDILAPDNGQSIMDRVLRLRQCLQQSIERLIPSAPIPESAREWRPYLALRHQYVDCLPLPEVEQRLGLGDRQLLRERNRGLEALSALLWEEHVAPLLANGGADAASSPVPGGPLSVNSELTALGLEYTPVSLCDALERARQSALELSARHGVEIACQAQAGDSTVLADAMLLRQMLLACLSHAVTTCAAGPVRVQAGVTEGDIVVHASWSGNPDEGSASFAAIAALAAAQRGQVQVRQDGATVLLLATIPQGRVSSVLIIEDNSSLLQLYGRYLDLEQYRVLRAETGSDGLALATREQPDVIVLDIMMRGMDGWEVLQRLRAQPETVHIPVVISSVLPERDLALSLGADAFLTKPISRVALLETVQRCLRLPHSAATRHRAAP